METLDLPYWDLVCKASSYDGKIFIALIYKKLGGGILATRESLFETVDGGNKWTEILRVKGGQ